MTQFYILLRDIAIKTLEFAITLLERTAIPS